MRAILAALTVALLAGIGCSPPDRHRDAAATDRRYGTRAFTWLVEHEPSQLDVYGLPPAAVAPFDPQAAVRSAGSDIRAACRLAAHDGALLLVYLPADDEPARATALDCGFALERDGRSLVLAPR